MASPSAWGLSMPVSALTDESFSDTLGLLYEAATSPDLWPDALDTLESWFGAMTAHVFTWAPEAGRRRVSFGAHSYVRTDQDWDYYYRINPRRRILAARPFGYILACHEHFDADFIRRDEFFNDYCLPLERRYLLGTNFASNDGLSASLAVMRTERQGPFGRREKALLARLLPHLRRAFRLGQELRAARATAARTGSLLDALLQPVLATDVVGRIRHANRAAEALLSAGDTLCQVQGRLTAVHPEETAVLQSALRRALDPPPGIGPGPATSLILHDRDGRRLAITVTPLGRSAALAGLPEEPIAFVTAGALDPVPIAPEPLRTAFALTDAEAELAAALASGQRLEAIAAARGVRMPTVRSQLRAILEKTRTSRQVDLVRLLTRLPVAAD